MPLDEDVHMDTISVGPKRSRSPSPSSGETQQTEKSCKTTRSYATITASPPPRVATTHCFCSHCFLLLLPPALLLSLNASSLSGIKFEVANLDNLAQPPESVTMLGEWSVKCWVASDDDPTYMFGRIFPISPELTNDDILTGLTVLDDSPTKL
ncbi:hypothetical protein GWK47_052558 [Chionoecetes opilio]|uniref:Uncharacterized protein n=1 Tax=Chionoecetes opilio TaxID=41210 RepID=A0A8J4Y6A9_CHIOP|nr:hypothetical protein GWK47_052558 [Chionoecetes opilio]